MKTFTQNILVLLLIINVSWGTAQEHDHTVSPCHTSERMEQLFKQHPQYKVLFDKTREEQRKLGNQSSTSRGVVHTIPVVFHILHAGGPENISSAQVYDALSILNRDFRKLNADVNIVNAAFQPIAADIEIEFALATKAPNGACFNGITRTFTNLTNDGSSGELQVDAVVNGNDVYQGQWPGDKYLNIYVCSNIGGAAGYTFFPWGGGSNMFYNGIFMLHTYTGSMGTSNVQRSRTLTHEVGHWLDLPHLWGYTNNPLDPNNCFDDDGVADTPNTVGWTSCNINGSSCGSLDNVENYMEYAYCAKMFTEGQKDRMRDALIFFSGRANIITPSNLALVGADGNTALCKADFVSDRRVVCEGGSVTFTDDSYSNVSGVTWTFQGGVPATSTALNPTVTYNTPGNYTVTLEATDGTNTVAEIRTAYITVLPTSGRTAPFSEGFENISTLPTNEWYVNNSFGNTFQVTNIAAASGTKSLYINNSNHLTGEIDEFVSTTIDLTQATHVELSFKYAFAKKDDSNTDVIQVWVSENCGQTWALRKNISAFQIPTTSNTTGNFIPTANDWTTVSITNILSNFFTADFQFKILFKSGGGNNLYIDDINLDISVGIEEEALISELSIYPNPAQDMVQVKFTLQQQSQVELQLIDILGREVYSTLPEQLNSGNQTFFIPRNRLNKGMYFVNLKINNQSIIRKLSFD